PKGSIYTRLELEHFDSQTSEKLTSLLVNIESLQISTSHLPPRMLEPIIELMKRLSAKLKAFKFYCQLAPSPDSSDANQSHRLIMQLINCINTSLTSLEILSLDFRGHLSESAHNYSTTQLELSVLSRLKEFNFSSYDSFKML